MPMARFACLALVGLLLAAPAGMASAQQAGPGFARPAISIVPSRTRPSGPASRAMTELSLGQQMNANTVAIISGTPGGTYFRMASDLAFALDDGDNLRILPILGKGAGQNAYDVRFLKGVDLAFVRTDTLDQLRADKRIVNIESHISYVARLFNDELHVIASRDITDIKQLEGKKVSFDVKGSGSDYTGRAMFDTIGVKVEAVNIDQPSAFEGMRRGEIAAVVSVAAKPVAVVSTFDPGDKFHLLDVPYVEVPNQKYLPAEIRSTDYPKLIPEGRTVSTLAVGTILAAYNWPKGTDRLKRITLFIDAFFSKFDQLLTPVRHPKWQEVNLNATVPGWNRLSAAQEWLDQHAAPRAEDNAGNRQLFQRFLAEAKPAANVDKNQLFEEFLKWRGSPR